MQATRTTHPNIGSGALPRYYIETLAGISDCPRVTGNAGRSKERSMDVNARLTLLAATSSTARGLSDSPVDVGAGCAAAP